LLLKGEYDLVQSGDFFQWGTILSSIATSTNTMPLFIWHELGVTQKFPGDYIQTLYATTLGRSVIKKTNLFIPRSLTAKKFLINHRVPSDKLGPVIHSGVNLDLFFPEPTNEKNYCGYDLPDDGFVISSVGRLVKRKGHAHLIRAFRIVCQKHPEARLIIVGEGPERLFLNELIANLKLQNKVKIHSHISINALRQLYGVSKVMVLPSLELFPNFSILESIACGTPVIFSSPGGDLELNGDGHVGYYARFGDPYDLAKKILAIVEPPSLHATMSKNAVVLAKNRFDMNRVAQHLIETYSPFLR
jgi:glycosyltransferase involved in cell wall biosynthesis